MAFFLAWLASGAALFAQNAPAQPPAAAATPAVTPSMTGPEIYKLQCAECHGDKGQGVAGKHDEALYGDRSLESLTRYIDRNMPEDAADKLDAAGSAKVAAWMYQEFYSVAARARLNPPQRSPMRLTNRQFQESVADLFASVQEVRLRGPGTGIHAEYYQSEGMNKKARRVLERDDQALDFDFKDGSPANGISAEQFLVSWDGSLLPQATGWHDFRVRTPNGARLYLNSDLRRGEGNSRDDGGKSIPATIDAWVSSGNEVREVAARVFLLGGRSYPLRFDFFKYKEKTGSVRLEWKPPDGQWEVLAAPYLSPAPANPVTTVTAAFPPDDASSGYERGTAISKDWDDAATKAAIEAASSAEARIKVLAKTNEKAPDYPDKVRQLATALAERAFRRPLTDDLRKLCIERPFNSVAPELGLKRALILILKSPRFLYPDLGAPKDDFGAAARLALTLWDSLPDSDLLAAAAKGELHTPEQIRAHALRMLPDIRTKAKIGGFFAHWLAMDAAGDLSKDKAAYPEFSADLAVSMRRSLDAFVDKVVWSDASDYRELLLADYLMLDSRLAKYYGVTPPDGAGFSPVKFDPGQRAGIFTHPMILTSFSYHKSTSPIHRGVFLTRNILGRFLKPPPMAIEFMDDRFDPSLTMREKVTELTGKASCMGCHATINPLGFSLENYDATGRWRTTDNNKPVNAASEYVTTDGEKLQLKGARDLAQHAATNREARRGFARHLFHAMVKQPPAAYAPEAMDRLEEGFSSNGCNMQRLFVEIALTAAAPSGSPPAPPQQNEQKPPPAPPAPAAPAAPNSPPPPSPAQPAPPPPSATAKP